MPKSKMKVWKEGDRVKLRTLYEKTNGREGWIVRVGTWDVDVRIGNFTFFTHMDQLEEISEERTCST